MVALPLAHPLLNRRSCSILSRSSISLYHHYLSSTAFSKPYKAFGAISSPPTDPNCVILLGFQGCDFLYQPNDHSAADWTIVQLTPLWATYSGSAIYCWGEFYISCNSRYELYVIDPFLQKTIASRLEMGYPDGSPAHIEVSLLEICGELFSVEMSYTLYPGDVIKQFRVLKADLSGQEWVSMGTLGDHALFHDDDCSVLLLASDVGCKRNSIYACKDVRRHVKFAVGSFDLGTGSWSEEDTLMIHGVFGP